MIEAKKYDETKGTGTAKLLDTFRAFRHKVRHIYGFMIIPENVITLARKAENAYKKLWTDLEKFATFVEEIARL